MSEPWTYEFSYPAHAPSERVYRALIDRVELEAWFAEHVRVEPAPGGELRFWGRYTVGTPDEAEPGGGPITALEPGRSLTFEWTVLGAPSRVTLDLTTEDPKENPERGPATRVAVRQAFERLPDGPRPKELVDDWWRFTLGNLIAHATGHGEVLRADFGDPSPEIRLSMWMDAPPDAVFRALTEPELLNRWMAKEASVDLREGGAYDLGFAPEGYDGPGMTILELEPGRKLSMSWPDWRGDTSVPMQTVTWLLEPEREGTRVTLVHGGFVRTVDLSDYPFGWGYFLGRLKEVVE